MLLYDKYNVDRFIVAQNYSNAFYRAIRELRHGEKLSHYMWFMFPQVEGLGFSVASKYYAISCVQEAKDYWSCITLRMRMIKLCSLLLMKDVSFSSDDLQKLKSSMTLFYVISGRKIFLNVLNKYFSGEECEYTKCFLRGVTNEQK